MSTQDFNPDSLLKEINKSILAKGIVIALVAHAVVVFGTSFSLYKDWAQYGIKTPSSIKAQKKEEQIAADKARREEEIKRKAEESAAASDEGGAGEGGGDGQNKTAEEQHDHRISKARHDPLVTEECADLSRVADPFDAGV